MPINSKYFDSIRIRSGSKEKTPEQKCTWEGCEKEGTHRAPTNRGEGKAYTFFCIEHVREYNKNYNYFSGLSDEEITQFQKDMVTGHRPTWPNGATLGKPQASAHFSKIRSGSAAYQRKVGNPYSAFLKGASDPKRKLKTLEIKAFVTLGLEVTASGEEIKTKYKALVKIHHPDANGGDRSSEERFREVLKAYNLLKKAGFC